ncbi:hypothetical protein [Hymenobacter negativus]|uniref:Uncharacterized protein n=1 Tax=Hymenobacter negativus TaxID=2795026 RepID=A0ABS3QI84_9BACT|nr:hypothetical protein [Hymenobacter negativus]MBO2010932.1 hypothetical protein [Hymenobacter negativus]
MMPSYSPPADSQLLHVIGPDCTLHVRIGRPNPAVLRIWYEVHNTAALPLYLCNRLYKTIRRDPAADVVVYEVQPNLANVQVANGQVVVGKTVVDVPEWMFVESLQIPCLSRVLPGETFAETLDLPLPLMPYTVYDYSPIRGAAVPYPLAVELGYFLASPYTEGFITTASTPAGPAYYIDPFPASDQSIIAAGPFAEPVAVVIEE